MFIQLTAENCAELRETDLSIEAIVGKEDKVNFQNITVKVFLPFLRTEMDVTKLYTLNDRVMLNFVDLLEHAYLSAIDELNETREMFEKDDAS